DTPPRRPVAGGAGAAAVDPGTDLRRHGVTGRHHRPAVVWNTVFDPVRAVTGQPCRRAVRGRGQPALRPGLTMTCTNLTPINSRGGHMKQTKPHCLPRR